MKQFRRVATRYEKHAANYLAMLKLAAIRLWLRAYESTPQFSPRLADIGETRFWRVDGKADYGALDELASQRINVQLIVQHCEDLLCLAGSLKLGTVQAAGLIRTLQPKIAAPS